MYKQLSILFTVNNASYHFYHFIVDNKHQQQQLGQMTQNLQQKYEQVKAVCKKQQLQIAKLQSEIRQRYQSFYLYNSRFKKGQSNNSESNNQVQTPIKAISEVSKLSQRSYSQRTPQRSSFEIIEEYKSKKSNSLAVNKGVEVYIQPTKQDRTKEINQTATIIESFKNRITTLQNNKNEAVLKLQKANNEVKQLKLKVGTLEKNLQVATKSQKKLKDKLKKIPEYQQKIDEIYIKLMKQVNKYDFDQQNWLQKHLNVKIQEIISWISTSKQKVDNILEDFNKIEPSQSQLPAQPVQNNQITKEKTYKDVQTNTEQVRQIPNTQILQSPSSSPTKTEPKIIIQNWTIISKLNEVDIKPFESSEVKSYNLVDEAQNQKQQENIIEVLQQNSLLFEEQLKQSRNQINELRQQLHLNRRRNSLLAQNLKNNANISSMVKEQLDQKVNFLLEHLQASRRKNENLQQELLANVLQCNKFLHLNRRRNSLLAQNLKNNAKISSMVKEQLDQKVNFLLEHLQASRRKNENLQQELLANVLQCNKLRQELNQEKDTKLKLNQQLQLSRSKLSELQMQKIAKQVQILKDLHQKSRLNNTQADMTNSKMTVTQQLQAPYFVEQELQTNPADEYVKRSFIRKKIVRRNLSATTYRIVSKSKQQVDKIISNKISEYRNVSRQKAEKVKASQKKDKAAKQEALQNEINRISEVSEPRDSGINYEQVRVLEVTTKTPNEEIKSTKIYTKGGQSNLSTRRKY